jgi:hypothetical protein
MAEDAGTLLPQNALTFPRLPSAARMYDWNFNCFAAIFSRKLMRPSDDSAL